MQIVIIEDEHDTWCYPEDVQRLTFKLARYKGTYPDRYQLKAIRSMIDNVTIPEAREWLENWYQENRVEGLND